LRLPEMGIDLAQFRGLSVPDRRGTAFALFAVDMRVLCAWCCREGQLGYLGEREPLDNPEPTHGICGYHKVQVLESLPSRSFPDAELLIVVRRGNPVLYEQLERMFATVPRVKVIVDRRMCDEPRHERTRRIRSGTISPLGDFTTLRFTPKATRVSEYAPSPS
jgi:hypothetical protein